MFNVERLFLKKNKINNIKEQIISPTYRSAFPLQTDLTNKNNKQKSHSCLCV